jgi:hypothetical protein
MAVLKWKGVRIYGAGLVLLAGIVAGGVAIAQQTGGSGYKLAKKATIGGEGGWDYLEVDPAAHHAFISRGKTGK